MTPTRTGTAHGIVNRSAWMRAEYGRTGADRVLRETPFSAVTRCWSRDRWADRAATSE